MCSNINQVDDGHQMINVRTVDSPLVILDQMNCNTKNKPKLSKRGEPLKASSLYKELFVTFICVRVLGGGCASSSSIQSHTAQVPNNRAKTGD